MTTKTAQTIGIHSREPVTALFRRTVKPGQEKAYEAWNETMIQLSEQRPGHISTSVIDAGNGNYYTLQQFDSHAHLQDWLQSKERHAHLHDLGAMADEMPEPAAMTGMETWFRLPGQVMSRHIPRWKLVIVTFSVIYILATLYNGILAPHLHSWPLLLRSALLPACMVVLMTYIIMPNLTKILRSWLYK
jgi:hypothetical protein